MTYVVWLLVRLLLVLLRQSNEIGCEMLPLYFNLKLCHAGSQRPCGGKEDLCSPRRQDWARSSAGICRVAFVVCNKSHIYRSVARTVPFLNRADLFFMAQEAPKCAPRARAVGANREPSARRRGRKQGPNFSKGKHGWTPAVPQQNNMNLHQKGVPISCAGCFWGEQLCLEAFCWGRCLPVKAFSTQQAVGPTPRLAFREGWKCYLNFKWTQVFTVAMSIDQVPWNTF